MIKPSTKDPNAPIKIVNLVHKDTVHSETIKKEMKYIDRNQMKEFQLNPHTVYILPEKPNYVDPTKTTIKYQKGGLQGRYTEDPVEEAFSNQKLEKVLRSTQLVPKQKFIAPMTANQEIGWFANQNSRPGSAKDHKLSSCEITNWASDFYALKKINPFKIR